MGKRLTQGIPTIQRKNAVQLFICEYLVPLADNRKISKLEIIHKIAEAKSEQQRRFDNIQCLLFAQCIF